MPIKQPFGKRVFIKLDEQEKEEAKTTASGILLPAQLRKVNAGTIYKVGTKVDDPGIKEGIRIFLGDNIPEEVEIDGEKVVIMTQEALICEI